MPSLSLMMTPKPYIVGACEPEAMSSHRRFFYRRVRYPNGARIYLWYVRPRSRYLRLRNHS